MSIIASVSTKAVMCSLSLSLIATLSLEAATIGLTGDYVSTRVSDNGTLGDYTTTPGLKFDPTGTSTWGVADYLAPGIPWEVFAVKSAETGLKVNRNGGETHMAGSISDTSGSSSYDNSVTWTGGLAGSFSMTTETFFNDEDKWVGFSTTFTAERDLTDVSFLRAIDPDQDRFVAGGGYATINDRGLDDIPEEDLVHSLGAVTDLWLGAYTRSPVAHNSGMTSPWSSNPEVYLAGTGTSYGDHVIGLGFGLGDMYAGESMTLDYYYVMAHGIDNVELPPVPEPGEWALILSGLVVGGFALRHRQRSLSRHY